MLQEQTTAALATPRTADKSRGPSPAAPRGCGKPPRVSAPSRVRRRGQLLTSPWTDGRTDGRCAPLPAPLSPAVGACRHRGFTNTAGMRWRHLSDAPGNGEKQSGGLNSPPLFPAPPCARRAKAPGSLRGSCRARGVSGSVKEDLSPKCSGSQVLPSLRGNSEPVLGLVSDQTGENSLKPQRFGL